VFESLKYYTPLLFNKRYKKLVFPKIKRAITHEK